MPLPPMKYSYECIFLVSAEPTMVFVPVTMSSRPEFSCISAVSTAEANKVDTELFFWLVCYETREASVKVEFYIVVEQGKVVVEFAL